MLTENQYRELGKYWIIYIYIYISLKFILINQYKFNILYIYFSMSNNQCKATPKLSKPITFP